MNILFLVKHPSKRFHPKTNKLLKKVYYVARACGGLCGFGLSPKYKLSLGQENKILHPEIQYYLDFLSNINCCKATAN